MTDADAPAPPRSGRGEKKRAAIIATAVTLPVVVILALLLGSAGGSSSDGSKTSGPLPALTPSAPPNAAAQQKPCTDLLVALPVQLNKLDPRVVRPTPATPFVVAWGNPAIVLSCGAARPKALVAGDSSPFTDAGGTTEGAYYDVTSTGDTQIYTTVDRAAYVSIAVPGKYPGGQYLAILNQAILKAMPTAVCSTDSSIADPNKLCTRRP